MLEKEDRQNYGSNIFCEGQLSLAYLHIWEERYIRHTRKTSLRSLVTKRKKFQKQYNLHPSKTINDCRGIHAYN